MSSCKRSYRKRINAGVLTKPNVELTSHASSTDMSASTSTMRTSIKSVPFYVSIKVRDRIQSIYETST
jgi:hypothetical protein